MIKGDAKHHGLAPCCFSFFLTLSSLLAAVNKAHVLKRPLMNTHLLSFAGTPQEMEQNIPPGFVSLLYSLHVGQSSFVCESQPSATHLHHVKNYLRMNTYPRLLFFLKHCSSQQQQQLLKTSINALVRAYPRTYCWGRPSLSLYPAMRFSTASTRSFS